MAPVAPARLTAPSQSLATVLRRSSLLHERLASDPAHTDAALGRDVLAPWRAVLGPRGLARRLAWDGLNAETARRRLGTAHWQEGAARWIGILDAVYRATPVEGLPSYCDTAAPVPFEELLVPFVEAARCAFGSAAADADHLIAAAARVVLERHLLQHLSRVAMPTFMSEFALHRSLHDGFPWSSGDGGHRCYRHFVANALHGGLATILAAYPALARLLAATAHNWVRAQTELLRRLQTDWPDIQRTFAFGAIPFFIEGISPGRSDPHNGGRSVAILTFARGHRLVYKPRGLDMEAAFDAVVALANASGFADPLMRIAVLNRGSHGWMAYIAPRPCGSTAAVAAFYRRAGGLLCLVAVLQGTDIHRENLIACGDQPVIVDLETLLQPRPTRAVGRALGMPFEPDTAADDWTSVILRSGFVATATGPDFSAFGAAAPLDTPFPIAGCIAINSDAMTLAYETYRAPQQANGPRLKDRAVDAAVHRDAIIAGFAAMVRIVVRHRGAFLDGLERFAGRRGRFVARSTNTYGLLLQASLRPEFLRDGASRGVLFERLRRDAVRSEDRPACWGLLGDEVRALDVMDVPRLAVACDQATPCWASPLAEATARIAGVSEADLPRLVAILERVLPRGTDDSAERSDGQQCEDLLSGADS